MSKLRVDEIQNRTQQKQATEQVEQVQKRVDLHTNSSFQATGPQTFADIGKNDLSAITNGDDNAVRPRDAKPPVYTFRGGLKLELPRLSHEERAKAEGYLASVPADQRPALEATAIQLGMKALAEMENVAPGVELTEGSEALQSSAGQTYDQWMVGAGQDQRDQAAEASLFLGMYGAEVGLENFFKEVIGKEALADDVRGSIRELEAMLEGWPDDGSTEIFSYTEVKKKPDGSLEIIEHKNVEMTKTEAKALLQQMKGTEGMLSGIATRDHHQLQYMVQKNQQAMNTLSNILKNQDETRKGIIQNAKA